MTRRPSNPGGNQGDSGAVAVGSIPLRAQLAFTAVFTIATHSWEHPTLLK